MTEPPQATRDPLDDENAGNADRRRWMAVLARAAPEDIALLWKATIGPDAPAVDYLRPAETGMVMTRGRAGGTGDPFNLGEMTVTRCSVRLGDDIVGHAYVAGRSTRHAEMAAILDALLQSERTAAHVHRTVIEPLAARQAARREARQRRAAETRVEFFTLVRGED